jgi:hypothetical protein
MIRSQREGASAPMGWQRVLSRFALCSTMVGTMLLIRAMPAVAIAVCATDSSHWYAAATGAFPALGTRIYHHLPTAGNWYVQQSSHGTSDEASWLVNVNNPNNALEGGFFTGWWPYGTLTWYSTLMPYITFDNGTVGGKGATALTPNTSIYMDVITGGVVHVGPTTFSFAYGVPNGGNYSQGEVTASSQSWMDDKIGDHEFIAYYTMNGSTWLSWASHNDCRNSPYFITSSSYRSWYNGGGLFNR